MKLLNINIGIKLDNTKAISSFIKIQDADFVSVQEIVRHQEDSVFSRYRTKADIETTLNEVYPYKFFGPLWVTDAFRKNGKVWRDFGGLIEQGNEVLSKFPIKNASNEHFYKFYSLALDWTNWQQEDHGRALQVIELNVEGKLLQILNIHGIWTKDKKGDQRTIDECKYVVNAAKRKNIPTIIIGDFNLLPDTPSIKIINNEFKNLINEYKINSTRPQFDDRLENGNEIVDYVFVNEMIKVTNFEVILTEVSDHLPLLLDFEFK